MQLNLNVHELAALVDILRDIENVTFLTDEQKELVRRIRAEWRGYAQKG